MKVNRRSKGPSISFRFKEAPVFIGVGEECIKFYVEDQLSDLYPGVRDQVSCIQVFSQEPSLWSVDCFIGIPAQPGAPPAEGAVGRNVLLTRTHQKQFFCVAVQTILGNKY